MCACVNIRSIEYHLISTYSIDCAQNATPSKFDDLTCSKQNHVIVPSQLLPSTRCNNPMRTRVPTTPWVLLLEMWVVYFFGCAARDRQPRFHRRW